jgi:hypothetical protein
MFTHDWRSLVVGLTFLVLAVIASALLRGGQALLGVGLLLVGAILAAYLAFRAAQGGGLGRAEGARVGLRMDVETIEKILIGVSVAPLVAAAMYVTVVFDLDESKGAVAFVAACGWLALCAAWRRFGFRKQAVLAFAAWAVGTAGFYASLWARERSWLFFAAKGLIILVMGAIVGSAALTPQLRGRFRPRGIVLFGGAVAGLFVFSVVGCAPSGLFGALIQNACLLAVVVFVTLYFAALTSPRADTTAAGPENTLE